MDGSHSDVAPSRKSFAPTLPLTSDQHWLTSGYTEPLTVQPLEVPVAWPMGSNGTQVGLQDTIMPTSTMQISNHQTPGETAHSSGTQPGRSRSNQNPLDPVPKFEDFEHEAEKVEELN